MQRAMLSLPLSALLALGLLLRLAR